MLASALNRIEKLENAHATMANDLKALKIENLALKKNNQNLLPKSSITSYLPTRDNNSTPLPVANSFSEALKTNPTPSTDSKYTKSQRPSFSRDQRRIHATKFNPDLCLVIYDFKKDVAPTLNQDKIRLAICEKFGPVLIPLINRYHYRTNNPKYIVQFQCHDVLNKIFLNWNQQILGGCLARKTIKPEKNVGIIKGLPLDIDNDDLQKQLNGKSVSRIISKEGIRFRSARIVFNSPDELSHALKYGVKLPSRNLILEVQELYYINRMKEDNITLPEQAESMSI